MEAKPRPVVMRVAAPVVALLAGSALLAGPGQASAQTRGHGWRIFGGTGRTVLQDVAANRARDAWAAGFRCSSGGVCDGRHVVVENWNGRSWHAVPAPRGVPSDSVRVTVGGGSPADAWLFVGSLSRAKAFHWNGRAWTGYPLPGASAVNSADVFGPRSAWAFGSAGQNGYVARFDGSTWRRVAVPGAVYYQQGLSAADIWAVGPTAQTQGRPPAKQVYVVMRWNGHAWLTRPLPRIKLAAGRHLAVYGLAATGPRNLWLDYATGNGASQGASLLRWNGRWSQVAVPYSGSTYAVQRMVPDGRRGLWLAAISAYPFTQYLYHYRAGRWSRQRAPAAPHMSTSLQDVAWIPGTASVWAVGLIQRSGGRDGARGVFLKQGR